MSYVRCGNRIAAVAFGVAVDDHHGHGGGGVARRVGQPAALGVLRGSRGACRGAPRSKAITASNYSAETPREEGGVPPLCRTLPRRETNPVARLLVVLIAMLAVLAAPAAAAPPAVSGQLLVGFEQGVSKQRQDQILGALEGRVARRFKACARRPPAARGRARASATGALRKRLARHPTWPTPSPTSPSSRRTTPNDPFYPSSGPVDGAGRPRHRRAGGLGHPHELRQGGDPGHRDRHRPSRPRGKRLQERGQAEQRQGRRQERLRRRHLRLERDHGQGLGRGRQRPRHPRRPASSAGAATTPPASAAPAGRQASWRSSS